MSYTTFTRVSSGARVMPRPVGKVRHPLLVAFLTLITFGIYGFVWFYRVFNEVDAHSGQKHDKGLYVVGVILTPFLLTGSILLLVYGGMEMDKLRRAKLQKGLPGGMGQGGYYALMLGMVAVDMVLFLTFVPRLLFLFLPSLVEGGSAGPSFTALGLVIFALILSFLIPYAVIQAQINKYWTGLVRSPPSPATDV